MSFNKYVQPDSYLLELICIIFFIPEYIFEPMFKLSVNIIYENKPFSYIILAIKALLFEFFIIFQI